MNNTTPADTPPQRQRQPVLRPRPHVWRSGPDPVRHAQYTGWQRARAQANYRRELWQLTFEQWVELWGDQWPRRGRASHCLQASRIRPSQPWCLGNIRLITKVEINQMQRLLRSCP